MQNTTSKVRSFYVLVCIIGVIGFCVGVGLNRYQSKPPLQKLVLVPPATATVSTTTEILPAPRETITFKLSSQQQKPFTQMDLQGQWSFMFFGYMNCPDVCPMTLTVLRQVLASLRSQLPSTDIPQVVFMSVDPDRDSPKQLQEYLGYFDPAFVGVTGDINKIDKLANNLGILYGYEDPDTEGGNYIVNHSAQILLFDPKGRLHAILRPPHKSNTIVNNFLTIKNSYEE